ncbi:MAG: dTDP-4-dehydrorhamnose reductase [Candidatus Anammoxibacter sp.]
MNIKIMLIGYSGMLGMDMLSFLQSLDFDVDENLPKKYKGKSNTVSLISANSKDFDVSDQAQTSSFILDQKPNIIINCSAYTDVDGCEKNQELAFSVNAIGVKNIAESAKKCNAKVLQISTDYVFDGLNNSAYTEDVPTNPLSVYGKSKLKGEEYLKEVLSDYLIVRTSWLYGKHGNGNYVETMLRLAKKNSKLKVVDDQLGSPTYTPDLAKAVWLLIKGDHTGVFNVVNSGSCSRYEWSKNIFEIAGCDISIQPVTSNEFKRLASVPPHAILDCKKFTTCTGYEMRKWDNALVDYLK